MAALKQTLVFDAGAPAVTQNGDGGAQSRRSACMCGLQLGARRIVITDASAIHDEDGQVLLGVRRLVESGGYFLSSARSAHIKMINDKDQTLSLKRSHSNRAQLQKVRLMLSKSEKNMTKTVAESGLQVNKVGRAATQGE